MTDLIKGLRSKHLESIAYVDPKEKGPKKIKIFVFQQANKHEVNGEWEDYTFTFDKWEYSNKNHKRDEPIKIGGGGFMG